MTLDLFGWTPVEAEPDRDCSRSIDARFAQFHAANPHVLAELLRLARQLLDGGATRIGVKSLWERCRESIRASRVEEYKLDNSLTAPYARLMLELEPRLVGVIEIRQRRAR
jgi:hypothetical protein